VLDATNYQRMAVVWAGHSLPTPLQTQSILAALVDPWNAPAWSLVVEPAGEPVLPRSRALRCLADTATGIARRAEVAVAEQGALGADGGGDGGLLVVGSLARGLSRLDSVEGKMAMAPRLLGTILAQTLDPPPRGVRGNMPVLDHQGATATLRRLIQLGGCPPGCMLARFSWSLAAAAADEQQAAGVLSARGLCSMWRRFVGELRRRWESNDSLWAVRGWSQSEEAEIEMGSLMLHQQLQLLEACMRWRAAAGVLHRGA
jgi:hypothetical protein